MLDNEYQDTTIDTASLRLLCVNILARSYESRQSLIQAYAFPADMYTLQAGIRAVQLVQLDDQDLIVDLL